MIRLLTVCLAALLLATTVSAQPAAVAVEMLDGTALEGGLRSLSNTQVTLVRENDTIPVKLDRVARIKLLKGDDKQPAAIAGLLSLNQGSHLPFRELEVEGRLARVDLPRELVANAATELQVDASTIRSVRFGIDARHDKDWARFSSSADSTDLIVGYRKQRESIDAVECTIESVDPQEVRVMLDGETISLPRGKVFGLVYAQLERQPPQRDNIVVEAATGLRVAAETISIDAQGTLFAESSSGLRVALPLSQVRAIDLTSDRLRWLGAMKPAEHTWRPYFGFPAGLSPEDRLPSLVVDKSFTGEPMQLIKTAPRSRHTIRQEFSKGIALRSGTETTYAVPSGFAWFYATAGIDPRTAEQGSVLLQVYADDQITYEHTVDGSAPVEVRAPLNGASQLRLVVGYGDNLDLGDRLHLGDARVTR